MLEFFSTALLALHGQYRRQADRQADRLTAHYSSRNWPVSAQKGKSETLTACGNTVGSIHRYAGTTLRRTGAQAQRTGTQESTVARVHCSKEHKVLDTQLLRTVARSGLSPSPRRTLQGWGQGRARTGGRDPGNEIQGKGAEQRRHDVLNPTPGVITV